MDQTCLARRSSSGLTTRHERSAATSASFPVPRAAELVSMSEGAEDVGQGGRALVLPMTDVASSLASIRRSATSIVPGY